MKLKKYLQFIKEEVSGPHEYGCVMVEIPVSNWEEITSSIEPDDVYTDENDDSYGIEDTPHLTLLYGLHDGVTVDQVKSVFSDFDKEIKIKIKGIGLFENEKFDVVKFNVEPTEELRDLHDRLSKLPNSDEYPDYTPHITLCYTKKGTGKKYIKDNYKYIVKNANKICYSLPNGKKIYFEI